MTTDLPALRVQLDRAREVQDTHEEARILGKMGAIMRENGLYQDAIIHHRLELQLSRFHHDIHGELKTHRFLGLALCFDQQWESAMQHHIWHQQLAIHQENRVEMQRAWINLGITLTEWASQQPEEQVDPKKKPIKIRMDTTSRRSVMTDAYHQAHFDVMDAWTLDAKYTLAVTYYTHAITLAHDMFAVNRLRTMRHTPSPDDIETVDLWDMLRKAYMNYGEAYYELEQYDKAYQAYNDAMEYMDEQVKEITDRTHLVKKDVQAKYEDYVFMSTICECRCKALIELQRYEEALSIINTACHIQQLLHCDGGDAYNTRGELYMRMGRFQHAKDSYEEASAAAMRQNQTDKISSAERNVHVAREAIKTATMERALRNRIHSNAEEAATEWWNVATRWDEMEQQNAKSLYCAEQVVLALGHASIDTPIRTVWLTTRSSSQAELLVNACGLIGRCLTRLGQPERAITWHRYELELRSQARIDAAGGDIEGQGCAYNGIGEAYQAQLSKLQPSSTTAYTLYNHAIDAFTHALHRFQQTNAHDNIITTQCNIIDTHRKMGKDQLVKKHIRQMQLYQTERYEEMKLDGQVEDEKEDEMGSISPPHLHHHDDKENIHVDTNIPTRKRITTDKTSSQPNKKRAVSAALVASDDEEDVVGSRPRTSTSTSSSSQSRTATPARPASRAASLIASLTAPNARSATTSTSTSSSSRPTSSSSSTSRPTSTSTSIKPIKRPTSSSSDDDFTASHDEIIDYQRRQERALQPSLNSKMRVARKRRTIIDSESESDQE